MKRRSNMSSRWIEAITAFATIIIGMWGQVPREVMKNDADGVVLVGYRVLLSRREVLGSVLSVPRM